MTTKKITFSINQLVLLMGLTQKELADKMELSESAIHKKLNKKSKWKAVEVGFILHLANDQLGYDLRLEDLEY